MGLVMDAEQRKKVAEIVVSETAGRVPVIVHVGAAEPRIGIELAAHAQNIGASAVACVTPFYYHPDHSALIKHYAELAESTTLPVLVYNIPSDTGNNLNVETVARLSRIPGIVGIKDSSRDYSQLLDYLSVVPPGFNVITGTETFLLSALCLGMQAGVSGIANAFPDLMVRLYESFLKQDLNEAKKIQFIIQSLRPALTKPEIAPLLETLRMRGLKSGKVKPPLRSMTAEEVRKLHEFLCRALPDIEFSL
jgi:dihydrodipicolinate synthase/N-acetylneuraminate lyase